MSHVANMQQALSRNLSEYKKKLEQTGVGKAVPEHDPKLTNWRVNSKTSEKLEAIWGERMDMVDMQLQWE